jgi:hypothetical protein
VFFQRGGNEVLTEIIERPFSDHYSVLTTIDFSSNLVDTVTTQGNFPTFKTIKSQIDWSKIDGVEFTSEFNALDSFMPGSEATVDVINDFVLTFSKKCETKVLRESKNVAECRKELRKAAKKLKAHPDSWELSHYRERCLEDLEVSLKSESTAKMAKKQNAATITGKKGDMKRYWDTIKSHVPSNNRVKLGGVVRRRELEDFFKSVYSKNVDKNLVFDADYTVELPLNPFSDPITDSEVKNSMFTRKPG